MSATGFVEVALAGRKIRLEYQWVGAGGDAPVMVFLHEGLGSLSMWRDFPQRLCEAVGFRGLVFSRYGYGRSTPRPADERWPVDFMQVQAREILPQLFAALGIGDERRRPWLFGHSDGGSIALIYAATRPREVAGIVAVAPHIMVEALTVASIEVARTTYRTTDLRAKLARHHADPDSAFWGWNDVWLDPEFRLWSIETMLPAIACPVLAAQGIDDEYGTLAQVEGIRKRCPQTEVVALDRCGHSPHRDRPEELIRITVDFVSRHALALIDGGGGTP
jgi:pimeloyl-ACP methyl ester carboxylesterase